MSTQAPQFGILDPAHAGSSGGQQAILGYLDVDGRLRDARPLGELPTALTDPTHLRQLYEDMLLTRSFDARAVALQRTGRLGTFASSLGQEAVSVGVARAMRAEDVLLPSFREQGAQLVRGVPAETLLLYWGGDERGNDSPVACEDFPICVPVGSHAPHAAGVALAFKLREQARVAVCMFGDGATSKGDVYEAMNFAGVHALPLLFVVSNNQWAISIAREHQSRAATLAQKAIATGFCGLQVDGNDVLAVQHASSLALQAARAGRGPTLLEAVTYRLSDHTTADDASRYRSDEEVSRHWKREPLLRLRRHLDRIGALDHEQEQQLTRSVNERIEAAAQRYLSSSAADPESIFAHLYEQLPEPLQEQLITLRTRLGSRLHQTLRVEPTDPESDP